ncbi:MAG: hypothetical protein R3C97_00975 [Geminicoccaceae bacterium]
MQTSSRSEKLVAALLVATIMAMPDAGLSKEYNQRKHVAPAQGAKIQRAIAKSWVLQAEQGGRGAGGEGDLVNTGCGGLNIGNVLPGAKTPDDQLIVIKGDVINAPRNCR